MREKGYYVIYANSEGPDQSAHHIIKASIIIDHRFKINRQLLITTGLLLLTVLSDTNGRDSIIYTGPRQFADKTVHRHVLWRQFTDKIGHSSPTNLKTVHLHRNTILWVLMKKINGWLSNTIIRFSLKEIERNVRSYCLCCLFAEDSVTY